MIAKRERASRRARRIALQDARDAGCICRPEVVIEDHPRSSRALIAVVGHERWCPYTRAREDNGAPRVRVYTYPDDLGAA